MTTARTRAAVPDAFPLLSQFAAGYLHQDFMLEHKTPEGAMRAFLRDLSPEERAAFEDELERFRADAASTRWANVRATFEALGGAWRPASRAELHSLLTLPDLHEATPHERRRS